jgi:hypothetical protein
MRFSTSRGTLMPTRLVAIELWIARWSLHSGGAERRSGAGDDGGSFSQPLNRHARASGHPVRRVDAVEAQPLFTNGGECWIARLRGQ